KEGTLLFSSGTPNLAKVIPAMDIIDKKLRTAAESSHKYDSAIRFACSLAKRLLNKYYSLSDASKLYRLAMMLHPAFKTQYFKRLQWPDPWLNIA
ncbi:hypothetical protein C8Q76DRAFT_589358, partial [Earliella scabrosa]